MSTDPRRRRIATNRNRRATRVRRRRRRRRRPRAAAAAVVVAVFVRRRLARRRERRPGPLPDRVRRRDRRVAELVPRPRALARAIEQASRDCGGRAVGSRDESNADRRVLSRRRLQSDALVAVHDVVPPRDAGGRRRGAGGEASRAFASRGGTVRSALGSPTRVQARSIHWSPYDRVGVVNADP